MDTFPDVSTEACPDWLVQPEKQFIHNIQINKTETILFIKVLSDFGEDFKSETMFQIHIIKRGVSFVNLQENGENWKIYIEINVNIW